MDPSMAEGLKKKLQRLKDIDWKKLGNSSLTNKIMDKAFIEKHVIAKQKAYNKLPITFNTSILKIGIQEKVLQLYSGYFQEIKQALNPIEGKVDKLITSSNESLLKPYATLTKQLSEEKAALKVMQTSQQVSEQEVSRLKLRQTVLRSMMQQLILSEEEKKIILAAVPKSDSKNLDNSYHYELVLVLKKILKIEKVIKLIQEYDPAQIIAESVQKEIKEMKVGAESKLLAVFKEIANNFENLNILNEIESYDIIKFTSQVFTTMQKGNEIYYGHCILRIKDALRKAVYNDYLEAKKQCKERYNQKTEAKSHEVHTLLNWLVKATKSVLDIAQALRIDELIGIEALFDDMLSAATSSLIGKIQDVYKEYEGESSLGGLYLLTLIIGQYQKLKSNLLEERIKFTQEEINGTAFLLELEEIRKRSEEDFLSLSKGKISKCSDLVQRVKDVDDYDKRVIDFFNEVILKQIRLVINKGRTLELDFTEVIHLLNNRSQ